MDEPTAPASLTLTLTQPAQISDRARNDFVLGTRTHLPGAVVRGAFAARWLAVHHGPAQAGSEPRAQFERLFEGGVRFGPLFTAGPPLPLSVVRHKYEAEDRCAYVEVDRARALWTDAAAPADPSHTGTSCPDCGSPLEAVTAENDPKLVRRRTHVSIGEAQVAEEGKLVTRETMPAGLSFIGNIVANDPALLDLLDALGTVQVGGRRTTHGLAGVALRRGVDLPVPHLRPDGRLVITLRSPGVFVDDWGRPRDEPNPVELDRVLGCPATVDRRWTRWTTVGGWHAASGLPKPTELAVAAGSTYLVTPAGTVDQAALIRLARRGLGLRRHEGFGDLGDLPALRPGRAARDDETQRLAKLAGSVSALGGLRTRPNWPEIRLRLRRAIGQTPDALNAVHDAARSWSPAQRQALGRFLAMPAADATAVLDGWDRR